MILLTKEQIVVRIVIIVSLVELSIMLFLGTVLHAECTDSVAIVNAIVLSMLSSPPIYIWVIKPFVNARDKTLAQIDHLAHVDPLTQLSNRRLLLKYLKKMVAGGVRHKVYGALLLLDLDGFKSVNDTHGHDAGDTVLVEVAKRLQSITRSEDVVGRLGGDEFIVLLNHLDVNEQAAHNKALQVAKVLINLVGKPFEFNGKKLHISVSIGIRLLGFKTLDTETAINEADVAMYHAKRAGKGCAIFFED